MSETGKRVANKHRIEAEIPGWRRFTNWYLAGYGFPRWERHFAERGMETRIIRRGRSEALFVKGAESKMDYEQLLDAGWNIRKEGRT